MYQVILRSRGLEITIDSEDDLDLSLDLLEDLTNVLHLNKHSIKVTPAKEEQEAEDYRAAREAQRRDTSQADTLEKALKIIGHAASPSEITEVAIKQLRFETKAQNPQDLIRQILRKYPRFKQLNRKLWTLADPDAFKQTEELENLNLDQESPFLKRELSLPL